MLQSVFGCERTSYKLRHTNNGWHGSVRSARRLRHSELFSKDEKDALFPHWLKKSGCLKQMKSLVIVLGLLISCTLSYRITIECDEDGLGLIGGDGTGMSGLLSLLAGKKGAGLGLGGGMAGDGLSLGGGGDGLGLGGNDGFGPGIEGDMSDAADLYDVLGSSHDDEGLGLPKDADLLGLVGGDDNDEDDDDVDDLSASLRELAKALQENKQTAEAEALNNAADVIDKLSEQLNKEVEGELKKGESELEKEAEKAAQEEDEEDKMLETELTNEVDKETQEEANEQKEENKVLEQLDSTSPLP
ncbi:U3 small nucleolar RNA-associated protein 25-like [Gigantopelta aegis]|uniref:U3 small nucleolar RNA-associated protein 25-like n=1 Tax=Gigantopelta aegis TaxID=1735272 RepID=UPI001B88CDAB|nr:U3 small nucleolar RNA-associated protein 25-like [Gigantopelta aegis]